MGLNVGQSTSRPTANWCTRPVLSIRIILGIRWHEFVRYADVRHYDQSATTLIHSRASSCFFLSASCDENADASQVILSLLARAGDVHLGDHVLPGWRPSKAISLPWIWSCAEPENWLRIDVSGDWCLRITLCTRTDAWYYLIGKLAHSNRRTQRLVTWQAQTY